MRYAYLFARSRRALIVTLSALALLLVGVTTGSGAASAQTPPARGSSASPTPAPYPPAVPCAVSLLPGSLHPGVSMTVIGSGFIPNRDAQVILHSTPITLANVRADASGSIRVQVHIPSDLPLGRHTLIVTMPSKTCKLTTNATPVPQPSSSTASNGTANTTVTNTTPTTKSGLASTGVQVTAISLGAAVLLLAGIGLVVLGRRRRRG